MFPLTTVVTDLLTGLGAAAGEIVDRCSPMARAVTRRAGVPEHEASDVVQATWLRLAIRRLPEHQRQVLHALTPDPAPTYEEIAVRWDMPVGSVGPTRARAVERLRSWAVHREMAVAP